MNTQVESQEENTQEFSPVLYKFTNQELSPHLDSLLAMYYEGIYNNTVGIMEAWNIKTNEPELILVGVEPDENGKPVCFPIAVVLRAEDVTNYLSPDGKGGYFDLADRSASAEAREDMKAIADSIVEA